MQFPFRLREGLGGRAAKRSDLCAALPSPNPSRKREGSEI
jgi:hypothetical protein